jgi:hypothetical protein
MQKGFPHLRNGVDAPRWVVFEVVNLKRGQGEVRGADYTRYGPMRSRSRRGRSAKRVIHIHAVDRAGRVLTSRALVCDRLLG